MTKAVVDTAWLDRQASRITALAEKADEATRQGLEHYRDIGQTLLDVKEALRGTRQGAFGEWCDKNTNFVHQWRTRIMKLAKEWDRIEEKCHSSGVFATGVNEAIALLRPPLPAPPLVSASEANKLCGLAAHVARHPGSPEAATAQRKLEQTARERNVTVEELTEAAKTKQAKVEAEYLQQKQTLAWYKEECERLKAILDRNGIGY